MPPSASSSKRSAIDDPGADAAPKKKSGGGSSKKGPMIVGLLAIIVSALGWTVYSTFSGTAPVVIEPRSAGEKFQRDVAKAIVTPDDEKFPLVSVALQEDHNTVVVSGSVKSEGDLAELKRRIESVQPQGTLKYEVVVGK